MITCTHHGRTKTVWYHAVSQEIPSNLTHILSALPQDKYHLLCRAGLLQGVRETTWQSPAWQVLAVGRNSTHLSICDWLNSQASHYVALSYHHGCLGASPRWVQTLHMAFTAIQKQIQTPASAFESCAAPEAGLSFAEGGDFPRIGP